MDKIRTTVRVAGKDYTMASYDSEEYVRRVAQYVDRKITELGLATRLPAAELGVLAAMNICDDMMKARDEVTRLRAELESLRAKQEETT